MKPRQPYGANPPGRLPATMIKVLAAELSDQGRLSRGKRYWAEDAVVDIVVGHGAVTGVIQGSRFGELRFYADWSGLSSTPDPLQTARDNWRRADDYRRKNQHTIAAV